MARALGGLVLAGGSGRRLGRPKAGVVLGGETLAARAVELLRPFCTGVVVATRPGVDLPVVAATVVEDPPGPQCALSGLASGLDALATGDVIVLACDVIVQAPLVERLLDVEGDVVVSDERGAQPLCGRYQRTPLREACHALIAEGDLRVRRLVDLLQPTLLPTRPGEVINVNTWPDLFAAALGVPALSPEAVDLVLDLTREVAHGTERLNGPLASFLAGAAAARDDRPVEEVLRQAIARADELLPAG